MTSNTRDYWDIQANKRVEINGNKVRIKSNRRKQKQILAKLLGYDFYKKYVLEIGCGVCELASCLAPLEPAIRYVGLDSSSEMVHIANSIFGFKTVCSESSSMPFTNSFFDLNLDVANLLPFLNIFLIALLQ